jgi:hypothetical protein
MNETPAPVIACDFDGCICGYAFPACGPPNLLTIEVLRRLHAEGWKIIIHSSRVNSEWPEPARTEKVEAMMQYLVLHRVPFDEVWGLMAERVDPKDGSIWWAFEDRLTGKPVAHVYWDDRGLGLTQGCPGEIVERCREMYHRAQTEYERHVAAARTGDKHDR